MYHAVHSVTCHNHTQPEESNCHQIYCANSSKINSSVVLGKPLKRNNAQNSPCSISVSAVKVAVAEGGAHFSHHARLR